VRFDYSLYGNRFNDYGTRSPVLQSGVNTGDHRAAVFCGRHVSYEYLRPHWRQEKDDDCGDAKMSAIADKRPLLGRGWPREARGLIGDSLRKGARVRHSRLPKRGGLRRRPSPGGRGMLDVQGRWSRHPGPPSRTRGAGWWIGVSHCLRPDGIRHMQWSGGGAAAYRIASERLFPARSCVAGIRFR